MASDEDPKLAFRVAPAQGQGRVPEALAIAQSLPEHFNAAGLAQLAEDLQAHELWCAEAEDGALLGFLSLHELSPTAWSLSWMAVRPECHRQGVGRALLQAASASLAEREVVLLEVKTLAASARSRPYERTRAFYLSQGFHQVVVWEGDASPWGPENPCAVLQRMV